MAPPEPRHFDEPWQARAFALTLDLHSRGAFSWTEWAAALSRERAGAQDDVGTGYYASWLTALEALVTSKGLATEPELDARADDWRQAYGATPHGKPVELQNPLALANGRTRFVARASSPALSRCGRGRPRYD